MLIRPLIPADKPALNQLADHPLQTWEWGEFREFTGKKVLRLGVFEDDHLTSAYTITVHPIPGNLPGLKNSTILYCPRCPVPSPQVLDGLLKHAAEHQAIYIKFEPNYARPVEQESHPYPSQIQDFLNHPRIQPGRPLFTQYNFWLDLTQSDEQLMKAMKSKWRYNIRLATKKGVTVQIDNSDTAFNRYLELTQETTERQGFYAHTLDYHRQMWQTLNPAGIAHLLTATYQGQILTTWILFKWHDKLYYPYGASTREHRNVMANHLVMWNAIQFGKQNGCTTFDLWGTAGRNPDPSDDWYGFHNFKEGFAPQMVKYVGTYDLILDPPRYQATQYLDTARQLGLRTLSQTKTTLRDAKETFLKKINW